MVRKIFILFFFILFSQNSLAYDYEYNSDEVSVNLKFNEREISELKFEFLKDRQKHFGIIKYENEEININLNTNKITFDEFKNFFQNLKKITN